MRVQAHHTPFVDGVDRQGFFFVVLMLVNSVGLAVYKVPFVVVHCAMQPTRVGHNFLA